MKYVKKLLRSKKYQINNLDITLICEKPRVSKYKSDFIKSVSKALEIDEGKVNIKGTTTEKLGFLGREEGIACQASVTISKINEF
jgi:2-C-methyl-D-erythritol 4-phosphate cytidylyltransferase/2-C-methyl-D-erythritol 2,4-cyclodiphosphate synthase